MRPGEFISAVEQLEALVRKFYVSGCEGIIQNPNQPHSPQRLIDTERRLKEMEPQLIGQLQKVHDALHGDYSSWPSPKRVSPSPPTSESKSPDAQSPEQK